MEDWIGGIVAPNRRRAQRKLSGRMVVTSTLEEFPPVRVRGILRDLPRAGGYRLQVKPLRYRTGPHLAALCDYDNKTITVQVPEPFRAFRQRIAYKAKRIRARSAGGRPFAFRWFYRNVLFRTKTDVIRFLYCHEYYHYYLYEILGRKGAAETACDRFALARFRSRLRRPAHPPRRARGLP
jgi:hypothetical protein